MKSGISLPWSAIGEACSTLFGWTCAMLAACFCGFLFGYWIGHRQFMPWERTTQALAMVPLLWLGSPAMIFTYLWTGLAWYAPIHWESTRLRMGAVITTGLLWFLSIEAIASATADSKFIQF